MLLGEHAVLHGRRALVCAINRRMRVSLTPLEDPLLKISSDLADYEAPLGALTDHPDLRFLLDAVRQYPTEQGMNLTIESDFSSDIGFGSSAAVTVATHAAFMSGNRPQGDSCKFCSRSPVANESIDKMELFKRSLATIHRVQGRGSGADVAASVFGGVSVYRADPLEIVPLNESFPLTAVYSGSKMKTANVIRLVEERRALNPDYYEKIFDRMDASVGEVIENPPNLGRKLIENQILMEEMGVCNTALAEIIRLFRVQNIPAKISGSGLGDCAVGLGRAASVGTFPVYSLAVDIQGVYAD